MNLEQQLLDLLLSSPKTKEIKNMAEELEKESTFILNMDIEKLKGVWELRWSSSKAPFLDYSPLVDNLQILDPLNLNGLNLLKPRGINSIIGTGIVAKLSSLNEKKIGVSFTHAGIIGPYLGVRKINALAKIKKEQKGWLEITFLSKNLRICRGDKGTLFVLRRIKENILFERFQEFIKSL